MIFLHTISKTNDDTVYISLCYFFLFTKYDKVELFIQLSINCKVAAQNTFIEKETQRERQSERERVENEFQYQNVCIQL